MVRHVACTTEVARHDEAFQILQARRVIVLADFANDFAGVSRTCFFEFVIMVPICKLKSCYAQRYFADCARRKFDAPRSAAELDTIIANQNTVLSFFSVGFEIALVVIPGFVTFATSATIYFLALPASLRDAIELTEI